FGYSCVHFLTPTLRMPLDEACSTPAVNAAGIAPRHFGVRGLTVIHGNDDVGERKQMRIRRTPALVTGLVAASLALAACSNGGSTTDPSSPAGGDAAEQTEVEVFTWWASGSEKLGLDALVSVFDTQHPNVEFINGAVAGGAGSAAKDLLQSRLQAMDPPDTFQAHAGAELTDYINAGQVQDVANL